MSTKGARDCCDGEATIVAPGVRNWLTLLDGASGFTARFRCYALGGDSTELFGALKFIWNATRGHRLAPWRSEFLRWRVETYSGKPAETLRARDIFGFMWESKWELLDFLFWTGRLQKEARRRP